MCTLPPAQPVICDNILHAHFLLLRRQFITSIRETDAGINKDIFAAETSAAGSYVYFSWNSE